jgi:hypothetical protein
MVLRQARYKEMSSRNADQTSMNISLVMSGAGEEAGTAAPEAREVEEDINDDEDDQVAEEDALANVGSPAKAVAVKKTKKPKAKVELVGEPSAVVDGKKLYKWALTG